MDESLFQIHLNIDENISITSETIASSVGKDDISYFFPVKTTTDSIESNPEVQLTHAQIECIKQIRDYLFTLTKSIPWENFDNEINTLLINTIQPSIIEYNNKLVELLEQHSEYKQKLQTTVTMKVQQDNSQNQSILAQNFHEDSNSTDDLQVQKDKFQSNQLSHFAIQSLISILLILIKSAEKHDSTIIQQILLLTGQLCEQLPMKCLLSKTTFLYKSLEPLTNYIHELSSTTDKIISNQAMKILLSFSIAKGSFKDLLSLLKKLIFNTNDIYDVQGPIIQLNNGLTEILPQWQNEQSNDEENSDFPSLEYLKTINSYPNDQLIQLNANLFTGQFLSSIILSHLDIENEISSPIKQFQLSSISCEFHPKTFENLFDIIEQLSLQISSKTNQILTVCLRLFTTHLQILVDQQNDLSTYVSEVNLQKWFDILFKLSSTDHSEQISISKEASKAFIHVINLQKSVFIDKLTLIHQYILENKYSILIQQLFLELNQTDLLMKWIENLYDEKNRSIALNILYWFIDYYFNNKEQQQTTNSLLLSFQKVLFYRFMDACEKKTSIKDLSSLLIDYFTYIFKKSINQTTVDNELFNSILTNLCLMTKTDEIVLYESIQSIFISIVPLLAEYYLLNLDNDLLGYLLGKLTSVLILGSPQDPLELKYHNKLKLSLFAGGCITNEDNHLLKSTLATYSQFPQVVNSINQDDNDFLMLIYNNHDDGARLINKLKASLRNKPHLLQKSIEQQANEACAAIFAVYIKFYRRINLAKSELLRTDQTKPYAQLLTLFEYAYRIQSVFATIKGQGGDCIELSKEIKMKTLFLLSSVKESHLIPLVKEDLTSSNVIDYKIKPGFHRQHSHWSKALHVLKILRNLFQACLRFKRFMLEKKQIMKEKYDYESLLNRTIENFIYGEFYKTSTSMTNEDQQNELNELEKCLCRQHERAMIRLITYRFIKAFLEKIFNLNEKDKSLKILSIYLPYIRNREFDWSYFDHIQASNHQLRDEISNTYYSIIKLVLPFTIQSNNFTQNIFYLLNLSYESIDICHLYSYEIIERLFNSFVSLGKDCQSNIEVGLRLMAFNWFRLLILKLCQNVEIEQLRDSTCQLFQQQEKFIFNTLVLNELRTLKSSMNSIEQENNSLKGLEIKWFLQMNETNESKIDLYINQYLVILLRCVHFHKHILSVCTTGDYLQELLDIYQHNQSNVTRLLTIKLLRHIIPSITDYANGISRNLIEKFLIDSLNTIGESSLSDEIIAELISMYRVIMSAESSWQMMAIEFVCNSIQSHLNMNSIQKNQSDEMKILRAALNILGGYIEPYRLGSIVNGEMNKKLNDDIPLALILEINQTETPYLIQYLQTNQTESVTMDKLQLKIDVPPPNLPNELHTILNTLGEFIQLDSTTTTTTEESLVLLQFKRCSISVLYHLLNDRKLIDIFMNKPYAVVLGKLCSSNSIEEIYQQPKDLRLFNKQHLEQYCLSLNQCERLKDMHEDEKQETIEDPVIINEQDDSLYTTWNKTKIDTNSLIVDALSTHYGWQPCISEGEMEYFKQGRFGNDDLSIVPMPRNIASDDIIQECGNKHRFRGRIAPNYENTTVSFPTFVMDNFQVSEGNWYYCVRLPVGGVFQIGWATTNFAPSGGSGVGDDKYSWSYDGSRGVFFYEQGFYNQFDDIRWKANDVCGCGIEIDGKNTKIKYWLNGKLLGTAFEHDKYISLSVSKCDLLPHGSNTTYYPAITTQWGTDPLRFCDVIVSPEDMDDCPLPNGYKPLLLPKSIPAENSLVDYPFHAYLIGNDQQEYLVQTRIKSTSNILRDFVHEHHLETKFTLDHNHLILPENSDGFLLSVENHETASLTISFDFQITSSDDERNIRLFTLDSTEITWENSNKQGHCVIIFLTKKRQLKVYINDKYRLFTDLFSYETIKTLNMHILPGIAVEIKNLAVWKYALSEEHIRRLFNYGLFYIVSDYKRLKTYRKQVNTISFSENQQAFADEFLLPFDGPFTESIWEGKKQQADTDESKYFKSHTVELFGNKTYLVLNKSEEEWTRYTLIFDLCIPQYPKLNERLMLVNLNSRTDIFVTVDGKLCLQSDDGTNQESTSSIVLNEYFRLFIIALEDSVQIYFNDKLELEIQSTDDRFELKSNYIELFKETDSVKNTTNEDTLRLSLKSVTYLNRSISIDQFQSSALLVPPISMIAPSLLAMGYKSSWIETVIDQHKPSDISALHTILREQKAQFIRTDVENNRKRFGNLLSKLDPSIDSQLLTNLLDSTSFDKNEQITNMAEHLFTYWISYPSSTISNGTKQFDGKLEKDWFTRAIQDLDSNSNIKNNNINQWFQEKSSSTTTTTTTTDDEDTIYQLYDLNQAEKKRTQTTQTSIQYSHKNLSFKQFLESRCACEYGLSTIYARYTVLNMLEIWSYDETTRFPFEKFGDYPFLITLLKLLDSTKIESNDKIDRVHLLMYSILKTELKKFIEHIDRIDLQTQTPFLYHLQKDFFIHSIEFLFKPSLLRQQSNVNFVLKTLNLFIELITDKTLIKKHQLEPIIPILFPTPFVNLIFDLFLLVPTHQSKLFILRLLTILIQTSNSIQLDNRIEKFFCHLLIELSSNSISLNINSKKKFEIALADFVYILLSKHKNPIEDFLSKLPEYIRNLFINIDVIQAWIDPTKEKPLPEECLKQMKNFLEDKHKVNQEDFRKSNQHFNAIADQDLINFMNDDSKLNDSVSSFIESLPNESEPNATFYKKYLHLCNMPADCILLRAKFIYLFNKLIENSLSLVDFNLPHGASYLTDQIRQIKGYLLSSTKLICFRESLEKTEGAYSSDYINVHFDTVIASTDNENSENTMFYQAYQQLYANAHTTFRRPNEQLWQAQYTGMHSTDSGGPYRDSITRICMDICSTRLGLFILCPNGRTNSGFNRDCWIPNSFPPNKSIPNKIKKQYRFVGQLMGMAIRKKHYLDLKFPLLLWKQFLREETTVEDIEAVDIQSFRIINEMEKNIEQMKLTETDNDVGSVFSSIMSELRFDVVSSSGLTYELIPGGSDISITASNFKQYCSLYRQYRLNEFNRQLSFIREGMYSVVPSYYLSLFTANELEEAVCGNGRIDVELLKRNTNYSYDYSQDSPAIVSFWTVLDDMFTDEQKKLFLIFVWGRSTLPTRDEDFQSKLTITKLEIYGEDDPDKILPRSHTCFFTIDLPPYSTNEIMYERLNYAITCCSSIDGDGTINDAPNPDELIFDDEGW
ncbi:hypothetical protein I4U23_019862 [Adineta vaga]|nr:hypothetical protein I4U23_019862 [Adineta vaga]